MSAQLRPYEKPLRLIADELVTENRRGKPPLEKTREFLLALTVCTKLTKEWFIELEGLFVMVALLGFFVLGVVSLFGRLHA